MLYVVDVQASGAFGRRTARDVCVRICRVVAQGNTGGRVARCLRNCPLSVINRRNVQLLHGVVILDGRGH